jgi:dethiobiotin synthetase
MNYFITAIHTNSGKTLVSAIITEALNADYWKPVQSGIEDRDSVTVSNLITNPITKIHQERYLLKEPASPHKAAALENIEIKLSDFVLPNTKNNLVIEGAGGVLVPLNYNGDTVIDLAAKFNTEIILVSNHYLGSINHTLLTVSELKNRGLKIKGIIFNNCPDEATEKVILNNTGLTCLLKIKNEPIFSKMIVKQYADEFLKNINA